MHMKREMGNVMMIRKTERMVRSTESECNKISFKGCLRFQIWMNIQKVSKLLSSHPIPYMKIQ